MNFYFKDASGECCEPNKLIFARQDSIIEYNIETEEVNTIVNFPQPLLRQPEFFTVNKDQSICIIASTEDGIYFNQHTGELVDLDKKFQISNIKEIICDSEDHYFYILSNMYQGKLGVFMIRFDEEKPDNSNFFLKYKNKLDISDADIAVVRCETTKIKELVVSYKTIHSNIYTV